MKLRSRNRARLPLHQRFARGYQTGLVVAIIVSAMVWTTTQAGLSEMEQETGRARAIHGLVDDFREAGVVLGEIDESFNSLSPRSDLSRVLGDIEAGWTTVTAGRDELPEGVQLQLDGEQGLEADVVAFSAAAQLLADSGAGGVQALDPSDSTTARRLESRAHDLAERMGLLVDVFEAKADSAAAEMRRASTISILFSLVFLVMLVVVLLRPLKRLMQRESAALRAANQAHREESDRQELTSHLADGLEAAETEDETHRVVERAFERLVPDAQIELLLADDQEVLASAVAHPINGAPGCGVESPWSCPAVRRGRSLTYEDSESINACPHLSNRPDGACSATCVPLSFMGESMGVIHATGPQHAEPDLGLVDVLGLVSSQVAVRIGTLRSFAQVERRVSTDPLTGLPNRAATEDQLLKSLRDEDVTSVVMADLDRFKRLNDKYGHEAGDRALRMFADAVRSSLRDEDCLGRWGGEEFVIVLPGMSGAQAKEALDRVRGVLADVCARAEAPAVTVSMGVVDTESADRLDDLVRLADEALLVAKMQGRDRVIVGPVMTSAMTPEALADEDDAEDADDHDDVVAAEVGDA